MFLLFARVFLLVTTRVTFIHGEAAEEEARASFLGKSHRVPLSVFKLHPVLSEVSRDAAASPPRAVNQQLLDLGDVVVGEESLLPTESSRPPAGCVLFDDVDYVLGIEAELVCVLSVVGVQSFALGHLGFGLGCRFGASSSRRGPAG